MEVKAHELIVHKLILTGDIRTTAMVNQITPSWQLSMFNKMN